MGSPNKHALSQDTNMKSQKKKQRLKIKFSKTSYYINNNMCYLLMKIEQGKWIQWCFSK